MNQALEHRGPDVAHLEPFAELNRLLGQRRAFATVGGRCSAAHAELLHRIRSGKLYLTVAPSWRQFCGETIALSRRTADRLIALLERFGPAYFELAELVGITPEQYAVIEPAILEGRLHCDGESISLVPENSAQLALAIHDILERAALPRPAAPPRLNPGRLAARGRSLVEGFRAALDAAASPAERDLVLETADALRAALLEFRRGA